MKSVGTRFLIPFGILAVLGSVFVFDQTYESSRRHAYELLSQQAAMALEFNLAIRGYAGETIRPLMEKFVDLDTFIPGTMSTSFISRKIFEEVEKKFPDYIIRFSSDNPRNPVNRASPDEQRMIEFFRENPQVTRRTEEIQIEGKRYLAHFSPMLLKQDCLRCHSDPKDAPAELIKRYGPTAGFHRNLGDVAGLDTVAVPVEAINASLAAEMRSRSMVLAAMFVLLFGAIFYIFRFVVGKRLAAMASHFDEIAAHAKSPWMTPVEVKGNDEISVVGLAFNKLVEHLRAAHASLEKRVGERTEELRHANAQLQSELTERQRAEEERRQAAEELEKNVSLLNAALDSTADGLLITGNDGRIVSYNQKFASLWQIPPPILATKDDDQALAFVLNQLKDPEEFLRRVKELYSQPQAESFDVIKFKDGKIFERCSQPQRIGERIVGRAWSFRDVTDRRRAEEALRESEKHYRSLFENMLNGYAYCRMIFEDDRPVDFSYLKVNHAFETLTGLTEVEGKKVSEVIPGIRESDPQLFQTYGKVALTGVPEQFETYVEAQGMWFSVSVYSPENEHFVAIFDVITERKQAEESLRESEKTLRALLDANPESVLLIDNNLTVIAANQTAAQRFSKSQEEFIGVRLDDLFPTDVLNRRIPYLYKVLKTGQPVQFEDMRAGICFYTYAHPVLDAAGKVSKVAILGLDVTERKRTEEALRDNEQFLTDIFNSIQDGINIIDPDFNLMRVNQAMENLPISTKPFVGRKCYEAFHRRSEPCEVCAVQQVLLTGQAAEKVATFPADDGSTIFVEIRAFPLLDRSTGRVRQVVEYVRNVTMRVRAEEERLQFSKLESVSILAGGIAHDFNNILTAILGNIGLAMLNRKSDEEGMESLVQAEKACFRAQELSRQLLTFAKGGVPIKKVASLVKLVRESTKLALAGSNSLCDFSLPENIWSVEIDEGQISQVINNLLINADQAMPSGGLIKIDLGNIVVEKGPDLPLSKGKYVKLTISDQGIGIPSKYLDKIFDPYFTTKQKGSGLGLATAYSIITKHSGYIKVESQLGVGTTFEIYLPAKDVETSAPLDAPARLIKGRGKVLVMDDDEKIREILCRMLGKLGYEADSANDGSQALGKFVKAIESERPFDVVILDLTVPGGMGGKETMERLLEIDPQVKAIVSSGYSDDPIMADFENYGFSAVIAKPYRLVALSEILPKVISSWANKRYLL